jgi:hypothetical protein
VRRGAEKAAKNFGKKHGAVNSEMLGQGHAAQGNRGTAGHVGSGSAQVKQEWQGKAFRGFVNA